MNLGRSVAARFSSSICSGTDPLGIRGTIFFLRVWCPFWQQTNSVKALKETRHALTTTSGLAFLTTRLMTEGTLVTYTSLPTLHHTYTHTLTHTTVLRPFFWDYPSEPVPEEIFWTFMVQGKITEVDIDHPVGWHSIRTNQRPTSIITHFYAGCPSCRNHPTLSWLGTGTKYAGLHT